MATRRRLLPNQPTPTAPGTVPSFQSSAIKQGMVGGAPPPPPSMPGITSGSPAKLAMANQASTQPPQTAAPIPPPATPQGAGVPSAAPSAGGGGGGTDVRSIIQRLLEAGPQGDPERLTARLGQARDIFEGQRQTQSNQLEAILADRGLIGQGPHATGLSRMTERLAGPYADSLRDIFVDESTRADDRFMQTLAQAAGLSVADARNAIDSFRAGTDRDLGLGNLALGNVRLGSEHNLALARLGLERDLGLEQLAQGNINNILPILQMLLSASQQSQGGAMMPEQPGGFARFFQR